MQDVPAVEKSYRIYLQLDMFRFLPDGLIEIGMSSSDERLVGRGDLENLEGVRTDSPTMDIEGHNLIFSFAASK